jgi:hypothetical protein
MPADRTEALEVFAVPAGSGKPYRGSGYWRSAEPHRARDRKIPALVPTLKVSAR